MTVAQPATSAIGAPNERGVGPALRHGEIVAVRNLVVLTRNPAAIGSTFMFPLIFFFGFYAVLRRTLESHGLDYAQYLPPIVVVQAMFFTAIGSAFALADDRFRGLLERCRSLPISPWAPLVGRIGADLVRALVAMVVVLAAGTAVGFRFEAGVVAGLGFVAIVLLFTTMAVAGCSVVGLGAASPEAASQSLFLPYLPLLMLSTGFVPVEGFPGWLQPFVRWQPVSLTVEALRALASGGPTAAPVLRAVIVLAVLTLLFGVLAARAYRKAV